MLHGGSTRLSLACDDLDLLQGHCDDDPETYMEILDALQTYFQMEYKDLLCLFSSQDMLIFLNRDRSDGHIYGWDECQCNLLILGEEL
jgi:hypothetical protein